MVVLRYYSPMEIQRAMQEPQDSPVDILVVEAAIDASDRTPYFPDEIQELTLIDDTYVLKLVFNVHDFTNF
jgi:hypothetical protein